MIQEHSLLVEQPSTGDLDPKVLAEKEIEEAKAVFAKHGIQVPGAITGASRTSRAILGLSSQKKRADKAESKDKSVMGDGTKSVASSKRSTTGKFEGGTKFGELEFIKKGKAADSGKQCW